MIRRRRNWMWIYVSMIWVAVLVVIIVVLSSCSNIKYVPVESIRTEYRDRLVTDYRTDTLRTDRFVYVNGDTAFIYVDRWRTHERIVRDTCVIERTDTIRVPYPVEKTLSRWEQAKMDFGGMAIGGLIIAVCVVVVWLIKKFRK